MNRRSFLKSIGALAAAVGVELPQAKAAAAAVSDAPVAVSGAITTAAICDAVITSTKIAYSGSWIYNNSWDFTGCTWSDGK